MTLAQVNIGIIGSGFARSTQIPAFLACEGVRIIAIASGHLENAETVAREYHIEHATDDWREIVRRDDVDLISIVTPPFTHKEMTIAAIESGKAVLCEKPTAMNGEESAEMKAAARAGGRLALFDHELRFHPARRAMRDLIHTGVIGEVQHCTLTFRSDARLSPGKLWDWWSDAEQGGGVLGAIGSHAVDGFRWLLGAEIEEVTCKLATHVAARLDESSGTMKMVTSDDEANLILSFRDSALTKNTTGAISMSMVESGQTEHRLEIFGSRGSLMLADGSRLHQASVGGGTWNQVALPTTQIAPGMRKNEWSEGFVEFAREIVSALRENRNFIDGAATFEDGHRVQLALDSARRSNSEGRVVRVEE